MSISIFKLVNDWEKEGYGIALVDTKTDKVIQPYIDPSDYPDVMFNKSCNGAKSICGRYKICFHSGMLEIDPEYLMERK